MRKREKKLYKKFGTASSENIKPNSAAISKSRKRKSNPPNSKIYNTADILNQSKGKINGLEHKLNEIKFIRKFGKPVMREVSR